MRDLHFGTLILALDCIFSIGLYCFFRKPQVDPKVSAESYKTSQLFQCLTSPTLMDMLCDKKDSAWVKQIEISCYIMNVKKTLRRSKIKIYLT